ncbi:class I SAM-dependent methyltransferase [Haloarchaeobius iranensis]|uniref:Thiopurine S-methyltransferase (TPMT) n=1 Tax=Haloarchaeobius iranensis TaxID=996166 RepID=A0A1H0ALL4_9EURY|nr:class I SAM-dependent methyltransferase [Haloarchaeobius iranensis]SDN34462.1 Thiopurine S-methyltransferase (TPMT) [Haloarchaeobius iranensis]
MSDDDTAAWWDEAYERDTAPWDTGEPQPALAGVADRTERWRVLDPGCGTGTHAVHFASHGHDVVGVDVSENAVGRARAKADEHDVDVTFHVDDVRELDAVDGPFDAVVDSGMFHVYAGEDRERYVDALADVLAEGGRVFLVAFGPAAPDDAGPTPVSHDDVRTAFADGWTVREAGDTDFETRHGTVPGTDAVVERTPGNGSTE